MEESDRKQWQPFFSNPAKKKGTNRCERIRRRFIAFILQKVEWTDGNGWAPPRPFRLLHARCLLIKADSQPRKLLLASSVPAGVPPPAPLPLQSSSSPSPVVVVAVRPRPRRISRPCTPARARGGSPGMYRTALPPRPVSLFPYRLRIRSGWAEFVSRFPHARIPRELGGSLHRKRRINPCTVEDWCRHSWTDGVPSDSAWYIVAPGWWSPCCSAHG
jgi:hypothetical protein